MNELPRPRVFRAALATDKFSVLAWWATPRAIECLKKDERVLADLRSIMTTVALRRTKATCQSRKRSERVELVMLTPTERENYNLILTKAKGMLSDSAGVTSSQILLQSILTLRQICSHGKTDINSNSENVFQQRGEPLNCSQCGDSLVVSPISNGDSLNGDETQVCYECALGWDNSSSNMVSPCPTLSQAVYPVIGISAPENIRRSKGAISHDYNGVDMCQDESGARVPQKSSKLEKILSNLTALQQISLDNQAPIKR